MVVVPAQNPQKSEKGPPKQSPRCVTYAPSMLTRTLVGSGWRVACVACGGSTQTECERERGRATHMCVLARLRTLALRCSWWRRTHDAVGKGDEVGRGNGGIERGGLARSRAAVLARMHEGRWLGVRYKSIG